MFSWLTKSLVNIISLLVGSNKIGVLTYHRVGESYNQLSMDEYLFEQQLIWLKKYFNPIGLEEGLSLQKQGKLPPRAVAITIDDGYVDSYTTIFPLLKKHQLKATFFISTSGIKNGYLWDELISSLIFTLDHNIKILTLFNKQYNVSTYNERLSSATNITNKIKYCSLTERKNLIKQLIEQIGPSTLSHQFLNEDQINSLHKAGMAIGSHTVNHPILVCESEQQAEKEMLESKQKLEEIIGEKVYFLAYPNGKQDIDFNITHQEMAKKCGFDAAFSTNWGCIKPNHKDQFSLKRFTPWDKTEAKFCLRLALNFSNIYMRVKNND